MFTIENIMNEKEQKKKVYIIPTKYVLDFVALRSPVK